MGPPPWPGPAALPGPMADLAGYGFSYQGLTQLLFVTTQRSGPDCLVPCDGWPSMKRLHWAATAAPIVGAPWPGLALQLTAETVAPPAVRRWHGRDPPQPRSGASLRNGLALLERHDPAAWAWALVPPRSRPCDGWTVHDPSETLCDQPMPVRSGAGGVPSSKGFSILQDAASAPAVTLLLAIGDWTPS